MVVTWLGGLSAQLGAAAGLLENDLKRVIAFSTTSQQGSTYNISFPPHPFAKYSRSYSTSSGSNPKGKSIFPQPYNYYALFTLVSLNTKYSIFAPTHPPLNVFMIFIYGIILLLGVVMLQSRQNKYFWPSYILCMLGQMLICESINKHGISAFNLYIN